MAYSLASRLERAVKNSGLDYKKVSGWASHGHGAMGTIQSIMCHHTAGPASGNTPSLNVVTHGRPGLSGPLAQLFLARDGTPYLVAAGRAWHAGRVSTGAYQNSHSIGIEAEATGVSSWPVEQVNAYAKLCKALADEFGLATSRIVGHKEAAVPRGRKIDPNFNMNDFRKKVDGAKGGVGQGSSAGGGASSKTYTVVSATAPLGLYDKDGGGRTRVKDWQRDALGYSGEKADGYFGPDTRDDTKKLQRQLGVTDDGLVGDDTTAAWEKAGKPKLKKMAKPSTSKAPAFPLPAGHYFGPKSGPARSHSGYYNHREHLREWQRQMKKRGWTIKVDGLYGPGTAKVAGQFQAEKGLAVDKLIGDDTWAAAWTEPVT